MVLQLVWTETDEFGLDADDHARALINCLSDALHQSHSVRCCRSTLIEQDQGLGFIGLRPARGASLEAAGFHQESRRYFDSVPGLKPLPEFAQSGQLARAEALSEVGFQSIVLRLGQDQILKERSGVPPFFLPRKREFAIADVHDRLPDFELRRSRDLPGVEVGSYISILKVGPLDF